MIVGDNIYRRANGVWQQENSHHSHPDGSPNIHNIRNDTQTNSVLISNYFFYFGSKAIDIPEEILHGIGYKNGRNHRKFSLTASQRLIAFLEGSFRSNSIYADPFDFDSASSRFSAKTNKVTEDAI
jgi:hypothetical protein